MIQDSTWPVPLLASALRVPDEAFRAFIHLNGLGWDAHIDVNCYDNAMVETVFNTLKSELVWRTMFKTRQQAESAIGQYIDAFYNPWRRHSALGFKSPIQFESMPLSLAA